LSLAAQPLGVDVDAPALAVQGHVLEHLLAGAPEGQAVGLAVWAGCLHAHRLGGDVVVVVAFLHAQHPVLREVQDVHGHGSTDRGRIEYSQTTKQVMPRLAARAVHRSNPSSSVKIVLGAELTKKR
jgi:hypothetical protein